MIPVILGVAIVIFTIMYFTPGDPATLILGSNSTEAEREILRAQLGLDQSFLVQLGTYLKNVFLHFDFGNSYQYKTPVMDGLLARMKYTLIIGVLCMLLQVCIGIPLGVTAAVHHNGIADRVCIFAALIGVSMPQFWLALILVITFSLKLGILPASGVGGIACYILPCIANALGGIAVQARQTRSSMLEVINSDYVTTARAKGLSERAIVWKHALPNALIPLITIIGNGFGMCLSGTVIIETVFSIPGVGTYMTNAIGSRDYAVVRGCVVILAICFSIIMLLVDLIYAFVDPRIKAQYERQGAKKRKVKKVKKA
jgi:peptide/nickel transport system permease protein